MYRIIKIWSLREIEYININSGNEARQLNGNNNYAINYFEDINQFRQQNNSRNNQPINQQAYQIVRDDIEYSNSDNS